MLFTLPVVYALLAKKTNLTTDKICIHQVIVCHYVEVRTKNYLNTGGSG